jgi:hypothetical protein
MKEKGQRSSVTLNTSVGSDYERNENDYYATDPKAIDHLFGAENFGTKIWEPACGGGHLSERMILYGKYVRSTDLIDRGYGEGGIDFLQQTENWGGDIITNPPYSLATQFVRHAISVVETGCKVAMLMRIQFLEGKARKELFRTYPPKNVFVYSSRLVCARNGDFEAFQKNSGAMVYAWYVWEKGYQGDTILKWIN